MLPIHFGHQNNYLNTPMDFLKFSHGFSENFLTRFCPEIHGVDKFLWGTRQHPKVLNCKFWEHLGWTATKSNNLYFSLQSLQTSRMDSNPGKQFMFWIANSENIQDRQQQSQTVYIYILDCRIWEHLSKVKTIHILNCRFWKGKSICLSISECKDLPGCFPDSRYFRNMQSKYKISQRHYWKLRKYPVNFQKYPKT